MVKLCRPVVRFASVLGLILAISAPAAAMPGKGKGSKSATFDTAVQDWHDRGKGPDKQRVIVRMVPGTRGATVRGLKAGGLNVRAEHCAHRCGHSGDSQEGARRAGAQPQHPVDLERRAHRCARHRGAIGRHAPNRAGRSPRAPLSTNNGPKGTGVGVAVIDSGISPSNVFGNRIVAFYDFTSGSGRRGGAQRSGTATARTWPA